MSVQFGKWGFAGRATPPEYFEKINTALAPFAPDSSELFSKAGITILYRAFHTTKESRSEKQPHVCASGAVLTWDGRLDNRKELIAELRGVLNADSSDVAIVASAYEAWGDKSFSKLIGDWALSIWNPLNRSLMLAKDAIGTKQLYYSIDENGVTWSTVLDPLVLFAGRTFDLCEEYIASWFANIFPPVHLTPYANVHAVPPSSFVLIRPQKQPAVRKYWDFDPKKRITYRSDAEYEEHFRQVFAQAVQRRLRSDRPVLAELSGGMDSSSIVCMADTIIARGEGECPRLDTISWFDDSYDHIEPDSNELHWISKVEEKRGRVGRHINVREFRKEGVVTQCSPKSEFEDDCFAATPHGNGRLHPFGKQYAAYMKEQGHRVCLSGIGGDEPTGNEVPTPTRELQDLLLRGRFFTLVRQLKAWATRMRSPRLPLVREAFQDFLFASPTYCVRYSAGPWFHPEFVRRNRAALAGYPARLRLFGALPSFQDNLIKFNGARAALMYLGVWPELLRDERYPYLDRDFLEFMFAIPRAQVIGVGKRRFLMKRALAGIVPDELINRKRKAFLPPDAKPQSEKQPISFPEMGRHLLGSSCGIFQERQFQEALQKARNGEDAQLESLKRTVTLEFWLRHLANCGVLSIPAPAGKQDLPSSLKTEELRVAADQKV